MMVNEVLCILMFVATCGVLLFGFPVAFTLAGTSLIFARHRVLYRCFRYFLLRRPATAHLGNVMWNEVLVAVPLFVFMGVMLERSKVAEELLDSMGILFGTIPGGLGISVSLVGALLAASTGVVGATVVTMGLLSLPTMLKRGYWPSLACGNICASATLGQIIPPSIVLVILGDQISHAHSDAQRELGNFSPIPVSVGDLFAGALIPGLMLVSLYVVFQLVFARLRPESSPPIPRAERQATGLASRVAVALVPPIVLIVAVLGSILAGVATPTEASSVGAVGALLLAGNRLGKGRALPIHIAGISVVVMLFAVNVFDLRVTRIEIPATDMAGIVTVIIATAGLGWGIWESLLRVHRTKVEDARTSVLSAVMRSTMLITALVFVILIGASFFSLVFRGFGGDDMVREVLSDMPGGTFGAMVVVMLVMFALGFFLDSSRSPSWWCRS